MIIWNPGSLPEGLSVEDLKKTHPSSPQNPVLAGVFFKGGLIEAWGRGTIKIMEECKKAGLPEPLIESYAGGISVTLFKDFINRESLQRFGLSKRQIEAVLYIKEKGKITNKEYQKLNSVSKATATKDLKDIFENYELIQKKGGTGVGTFYILKGLKGL